MGVRLRRATETELQRTAAARSFHYFVHANAVHVAHHLAVGYGFRFKVRRHGDWWRVSPS